MVSLPKQMESETEGDFEVFRNIPVFDEHTGDDGVVYDKRRLQCIANNNNDRIEDTDDWCPLVPGHTPDEPGKEQPEIIGYAGPFRVGIIGNKKPRHCIFADFRVHRDHAETFRKNPRRSVELWPEENPDDRFFDPIAILGAETPKRPLGMTRYKASAAGRKRIRYELGSSKKTGVPAGLASAAPTLDKAIATTKAATVPKGLRNASPTIDSAIARTKATGTQQYNEGAEAVTPTEGGGHNTHIPGVGTGKKKKPQTFNQEGNDMEMAITPEILAQLMEAQAPLMQAMIDESLSNLLENNALSQAEPEAEEPGLEGIGNEPTPDMATPPAPAPPMEGEIPPMEPEGEIPPMDDPAAPSDAPPPEDMPTGAPDEEEEKERTPFQKYAHGKYMKYMCADEGEHKADAMEYAMKFANSLDESDRAEMADVYGMGEDDGQKAFYAKLKFAMGDGDDPMKTENPPGQSEGKEHDYGKVPKMDYAKKYAKAIAEKNALVNRNAVLEADAAKANRAVKHAKRVAALNLLAEDYVVPEDEITHVETMTDAQFDAHVARIPQTYQKAKGPALASQAHAPDNRPSDTKADADSATAKAAVEKYSKKGRRIPFREAFANVEANNGVYVEA